MRVAFISDVHSNAQALTPVLAKIEEERVDAVYCLGDLVGYAANPNEVLHELRARQVTSLMGNHDWAATVGTSEGFNQTGRAGVLYSKRVLTAEHATYLASLSSHVAVPLGDLLCLFVHASPFDPLFEYVLPQDAELRREEFDALPYDVVAMGHTHVPFTMELGRRRLVFNPGSVGQPRDHDPRASFAILDTDACAVKHHRVSYDIHGAIDAIQAAGLPDFSGLRLLRGI
ncbi:MAG: metallophosphoesterase family protein [Methanobacteriota archaeon]